MFFDEGSSHSLKQFIHPYNRFTCLLLLPASLVTPAFRSIFAVSKDFLTVGGGRWAGLATSCSGCFTTVTSWYGCCPKHGPCWFCWFGLAPLPLTGSLRRLRLCFGGRPGSLCLLHEAAALSCLGCIWWFCCGWLRYLVRSLC